MFRGLAQRRLIGQGHARLARVMPQAQHRAHGHVDAALQRGLQIADPGKQCHQLRLGRHRAACGVLVYIVEVMHAVIGVVPIKHLMIAHKLLPRLADHAIEGLLAVGIADDGGYGIEHIKK